jgi:hypothetical protein
MFGCGARGVELQIAAAWCALDKLTTDEAINAAHQALKHGVYSDALGAVTFVEPIWSEVGPLFIRALDELGVVIPERSAAVQRLARNFASRILAGELAPYEGACAIWLQLALEPEAGNTLLNFVGLACEWEEHQEHRKVYEANIVREARLLVQSSEAEPDAAADEARM